MEAKTNLIEPLIEKTETYIKTSVELFKLRSIDKTADVGSTLISRLAAILVFTLFILTINIALALWLGELFGKFYYGFLIVASFYALLGTVLLLIHPTLKTRLNNLIIQQLMN